MTDFEVYRGINRYGNVKINGHGYKYIFSDLYILLNLCKNIPEVLEGIETILSSHRSRPVKILDIVIENIDVQKRFKGAEYNYLLLCDNTHEGEMCSIVGICLILFGGVFNDGYISLVHIMPEYRGKKICAGMVELLLELASEEHQIWNFSLNVHIDNPVAIRCYQNVGFNEESRSDTKIKMVYHGIEK